MGILDDLFNTAETAAPKNDGAGTRWDGGHATTRCEPDGTIDHHHTDHRTGQITGWKHNPETGESSKYTKP